MGRSKVEKKVEELEGLLYRLRAIQGEMPDSAKQNPSQGKSKSKAASDPFLQLKSDFVTKLLGVKQTIKDMQDAQYKYTTKTTEQIAKQQEIRGAMRELNQMFKDMEALLQKDRKKKKKDNKELEERATFLRQFEIELQQLKPTSTLGYLNNTANSSPAFDVERGMGTGLDTASFLKSAGSDNVVAGGNVTGSAPELTLTQQQELQQIKERDKQFDETLEVIEQAVDQAGELAKQINDETKIQGEMLDKLTQDVDKVQDHMDSVNVKMKKSLIEKGAGFERFCINAICCVVLLGIIGVIINIIG